MNSLGLIQRIDELIDKFEKGKGIAATYQRFLFYNGAIHALKKLKSEIMPEVWYDELRGKIIGGKSGK